MHGRNESTIWDRLKGSRVLLITKQRGWEGQIERRKEREGAITVGLGPVGMHIRAIDSIRGGEKPTRKESCGFSKRTINKSRRIGEIPFKKGGGKKRGNVNSSKWSSPRLKN